MKKIIIIPTYNEAENIEALLLDILALRQAFDVLVVDDSSPDGTGNIVSKLSERYSENIFLLVRTADIGLGPAYIAGFAWALDKEYELIYQMDADFSHNPQDLMRLHDACCYPVDMVIGSRYVKNGGIADWSWTRILLSYLASVYVRLALSISIRDTTAGFVCYKRHVLEKTDFKLITSVGYGFQIEMKYQAIKNNFRIIEVPITFKDRVKGESKMHSGIIREAFWAVLEMRKKKYRVSLCP